MENKIYFIATTCFPPVSTSHLLVREWWREKKSAAWLSMAKINGKYFGIRLLQLMCKSHWSIGSAYVFYYYYYWSGIVLKTTTKCTSFRELVGIKRSTHHLAQSSSLVFADTTIATQGSWCIGLMCGDDDTTIAFVAIPRLSVIAERNIWWRWVHVTILNKNVKQLHSHSNNERTESHQHIGRKSFRFLFVAGFLSLSSPSAQQNKIR